MSKLTVVGLLLCVVGGVIFGFEVISSLVGQEHAWQSLCLYDVTNPDTLDWIDSVTWLGLDKGLDAVAVAPLYILLLVVGGICLLISGFVKT